MALRMSTCSSLLLCCSCLSSLASFKFFVVATVFVVLACVVALGVVVHRFAAALFNVIGLPLPQLLLVLVFQCYVCHVSSWSGAWQYDL